MTRLHVTGCLQTPSTMTTALGSWPSLARERSITGAIHFTSLLAHQSSSGSPSTITVPLSSTGVTPPTAMMTARTCMCECNNLMRSREQGDGGRSWQSRPFVPKDYNHVAGHCQADDRKECQKNDP